MQHWPYSRIAYNRYYTDTMMPELTVEVAHRPCAFVLHIQDPAETLKDLAAFLQERKIVVSNLQLHRYRDGDGLVIIHCQLEKDRIWRTVQLMEQIDGISKIEKMEGR